MNTAGEERSISVIVPVFNGAEYLKECLESVVSQTVAPLEIIVIDDGSTDDSEAIASSFKQIAYLKTGNRGVSPARNTGIEMSRGKWIAFIDQDDVWTPDSLEQRINVFRKFPHAEIVTGRQKWFLHKLTETPSWVRPGQLDNPMDGYLLGCALIHRDMFNRFGMFDTSYRFTSDFDWFFRLKDGGIQFPATDEIVLLKRIHDANESRHTQPLLQELSRAAFESIKRKRRASNTLQA